MMVPNPVVLGVYGSQQTGDLVRWLSESGVSGEVTPVDAVAGATDLSALLLADNALGPLELADVVSDFRGRHGGGPWIGICAGPLSSRDRDMLADAGADRIACAPAWSARWAATRAIGMLGRLGLLESEQVPGMLGVSSEYREMLSKVRVLSRIHDPVLIRGETGVGKEAVAKAIHSDRETGHDYIAINIASISTELIESELFGHAEGAFTGAMTDRIGLLEKAEEGTVLIDEIGDLPIHTQASLLRFVEERTVRPVGSNQWRPVSARLLFATHQPLEKMCAEGRFRQDLLERLRGFSLVVPPLRERREDIEILSVHFLDMFNTETGRELQASDRALDLLVEHDWPGNVRELRAVVRRSAAFTDPGNRYISVPSIQESLRVPSPRLDSMSAIASAPWRLAKTRLKRMYFEELLRRADGNKALVARMAGVSRSTVEETFRPDSITASAFPAHEEP